MADTVKTIDKLTFEINYVNGDGDTAKRTLSFDTFLAGAAKKTAIIAFANRLRNGPYKYAIQPTNWRDDDDAESAWEVSSVEARIVTTTTTTIDSGNWEPEE